MDHRARVDTQVVPDVHRDCLQSRLAVPSVVPRARNDHSDSTARPVWRRWVCGLPRLYARCRYRASWPTTAISDRGPFDHIVLEEGEVESSSNIDVLCEVKTRGSSAHPFCG